MGKMQRNHIITKREPKIFYKKNTGILSEITSGNIKKEKSEIKKNQLKVIDKLLK